MSIRDWLRGARLAAILVALVSAVACTRGEPAATGSHLVERTQVAMGSSLSLTAWTEDDAAAVAAFDAVFVEFEHLDALMSVWRDGSEIVRLNAAAGEHPVPIGPDVRDALLTARQMSDWTDGKFDVTFYALAGLWKFDAQDQDNTVPDMNEVRKRLPLINYRDLIVDERAGTAFLKRKGMRVNLGGIGKGYAVDRAREILGARGFHDFMIQAGGDLYVAGKKGGRPWRLGIRDPRGPADKIFATIDLSDSTFSTSGDYERFFMKNGRRYGRRAGPIVPERHPGHRPRGDCRCAGEGRVHPRAHRGDGAHRAYERRAGRHRERQERGSRVVGLEEPACAGGTADRCTLGSSDAW